MKIVIPGGTGFLGCELSGCLRQRGDRVTVLTRGPSRHYDGVEHVHWDSATPG